MFTKKICSKLAFFISMLILPFSLQSIPKGHDIQELPSESSFIAASKHGGKSSHGGSRHSSHKGSNRSSHKSSQRSHNKQRGSSHHKQGMKQHKQSLKQHKQSPQQKKFHQPQTNKGIDKHGKTGDHGKKDHGKKDHGKHDHDHDHDHNHHHDGDHWDDGSIFIIPGGVNGYLPPGIGDFDYPVDGSSYPPSLGDYTYSNEGGDGVYMDTMSASPRPSTAPTPESSTTSTPPPDEDNTPAEKPPTIIIKVPPSPESSSSRTPPTTPPKKESLSTEEELFGVSTVLKEQCERFKAEYADAEKRAQKWTETLKRDQKTINETIAAQVRIMSKRQATDKPSAEEKQLSETLKKLYFWVELDNTGVELAQTQMNDLAKQLQNCK